MERRADVSAANLLVRQGRLCAVIDFGMLGVGDPACDLAIAWTLLTPESRAIFRGTLAVDAGMWTRARGWALWKSSIVAAGNVATNALDAGHALRIIDGLLAM